MLRIYSPGTYFKGPSHLQRMYKLKRYHGLPYRPLWAFFSMYKCYFFANIRVYPLLYVKFNIEPSPSNMA